jgi:hypothetical protein
MMHCTHLEDLPEFHLEPGMPWVAVSRSKSTLVVPLNSLEGLPEFHLEPGMPWVAVSRSKSVFEVPLSDVWGLPEFHLEPGMPWVAVSRSKSWPDGSGRRRGEPSRPLPAARRAAAAAVPGPAAAVTSRAQTFDLQTPASCHILPSFRGIPSAFSS